MKGVPIDESLCAYLKKYHKGQENAASSKELSAGRNCGGWSTAGAVTATPFAAPIQATSTRRGD